MGNPISKVLLDQEDKGQSETLEKLKLLKETMVNKVAAASAIMRDKALQDESLPVAAIVDTSEKYSVNVKESLHAKDVTGAVREILSGEFMEGFLKVLEIGVNAFLKSSEAGASEMRDFHVIFSNNTLLRIDFMVYKYQFSAKGFKDDFENGFCYCSQTTVLDVKKVNPQVVLHELTRAIGQDRLSVEVKKLDSISNFGVGLYHAINKMSKAAEDGGKDFHYNATDEFEWKPGEDTFGQEEEEDDDANVEKHSGWKSQVVEGFWRGEIQPELQFQK